MRRTVFAVHAGLCGGAVHDSGSILADGIGEQFCLRAVHPTAVLVFAGAAGTFAAGDVEFAADHFADRVMVWATLAAENNSGVGRAGYPRDDE